MEEVTPTERKYLNDAIDEILDLEKEEVTPPEDPTPTTPPPTVAVEGKLIEDDTNVKKNIVKNSDTSTPLSGRVANDYIKERSQDIRDDYNQARSTLQDLIEEGKDALEYLIKIAKATDKYEYFDSVSKLIKELTNTTEKLMGTQASRTELDKEIDGENNQPSTVNNNLFVGSTKELLDMINGNGKKIDKQ